MIKHLRMGPTDNDKTFFVELLGFKELSVLFGSYNPADEMVGWKRIEKTDVNVKTDHLGATYGDSKGKIRKSKTIWYLYYPRHDNTLREVFVLGSVKTAPNPKYILLGNKKLVVR